ncbi:MAG: DUF3086 domain-containing protein [Cyanothece sp. SIO1E1]|nr:DUF3086 domain-containing protein [Cyanothece sp. SIO1E1]
MSPDEFLTSNSTGESATQASGEAANQVADLERRIAALQRQEASLKQSVQALESSRDRMRQTQRSDTEATLGRLVQAGLSDLERRKQMLQIEVEKLERRQERIQAEMRTSFAGTSQDLAIRVQGFKDYLVGSLQDLAAAAEKLDLVPPSAPATPSMPKIPEPEVASQPASPQFVQQRFDDQIGQIRSILDQYRTRPDYYGPPWQLRRTFEPIHAERVSNWILTQGGRGAVRSMGSRLQNILIASAAISVLRTLYDDRLRTLVLVDTPERLGEWRRGLQDCLGISRSDFGNERGVVLFEAPDPLAQRADRLVKRGDLPLIIMDESEDKVNLSLLQFPLWLAFAPDPLMPTQW